MSKSEKTILEVSKTINEDNRSVVWKFNIVATPDIAVEQMERLIIKVGDLEKIDDKGQGTCDL